MAASLQMNQERVIQISLMAEYLVVEHGIAALEFRTHGSLGPLLDFLDELLQVLLFDVRQLKEWSNILYLDLCKFGSRLINQE